MTLLLRQQGSEHDLGAERLQQLQMAQVQLPPFGAPKGEAGRFIRTWPLRHAGTPGRRAKGAEAEDAVEAEEAAEAVEAEEAAEAEEAEEAAEAEEAEEAEEVFLDVEADDVRLRLIVFVGSHLLTLSVKRSRFVLAKAERDEIALVKMGSLCPTTHTGTCCPL